MLRRVDISKINLGKAYFHFTNKNNIDIPPTKLPNNIFLKLTFLFRI